MAINNSRRHLTKVMTLVMAILTIFMTTTFTRVMASPVLIDDNGTIKSNTNKDDSGGITGGVVDIPKESAAIFKQLRLYLGGTLGIVLITLTMAFVIKCGQLAAAADNAQKRSNHISGMLYLIIAIAGVGAFDIVMDILVGLATKGI